MTCMRRLTDHVTDQGGFLELLTYRACQGMTSAGAAGMPEALITCSCVVSGMANARGDHR